MKGAEPWTVRAKRLGYGRSESSNRPVEPSACLYDLSGKAFFPPVLGEIVGDDNQDAWAPIDVSAVDRDLKRHMIAELIEERRSHSVAVHLVEDHNLLPVVPVEVEAGALGGWNGVYRGAEMRSNKVSQSSLLSAGGTDEK